MDDEALKTMITELIKTEITSALLAFGFKPKSATPDADRMRRYRQNKKATQANANVTRKPHKANGSVTHANGSVTHIGDGDLVTTFPGLKGEVEIRKGFIAELIEAYPAVMVGQEIDRAKLWVEANPTKRKTNVRKFLTSWVSRSQERA